MPDDLTYDDKAILAELLRETIARDRFPLSPRVRGFKAILAKLDPPPPVETLPVPKPPGERSMAGANAQHRRVAGGPRQRAPAAFDRFIAAVPAEQHLRQTTIQSGVRA